jgi:hypothetical protein
LRVVDPTRRLRHLYFHHFRDGTGTSNVPGQTLRTKNCGGQTFWTELKKWLQDIQTLIMILGVTGRRVTYLHVTIIPRVLTQ